MAADEACLPGVGINDPALGSVRFAASEYTTLNLKDAICDVPNRRPRTP